MNEFDRRLIEVAPSHGELCSLLVDWECRRRGAQVHRSGSLLVVATLGGRSVPFQRSVGPDVSFPSERVTRDKHLTKHVLAAAGLPVPAGLQLGRDAVDDAVEFARSRRFAVVVKPIGSAGGTGVFTEIADEEQLRSAWSRLASMRVATRGVIVEERITGDDARMFVIDGEVVAVLGRLPARVVGDGKATIEALVERQNQERSSNPDLRARRVVIDGVVRRKLRADGLGPSSVLPTGVTVLLRHAANLSKGGVSEDLTDRVHPGFREVAARAVAAIPGRPAHCTVDLIAPSIEESPDSSQWAINEVEGDPGMGIHHFPASGRPRHVAARIVSHYFPGTSDEDPEGVWYRRGEDQRSLDALDAALVAFGPHRRSTPPHLASASSAPDAGATADATAEGVVHESIVRLVVSGTVQGVGFRDWACERADELGVSGWVRNRTVRTVEVVVAGDRSAVETMTRLCESGPPGASVKNVRRAVPNRPVGRGFVRRRSFTL